ncbi:hypothetical protein [Vibrio porteresiae]|uniref:Lipoprotein n=1 Tax=Vibrio porteresiae DSM 19223 TaxID=1123496 RepID=A0ABZ0QE85_9VIBR|nr:hypothetical protein [Vibrio porteresiae]WPC74316.1 hypothetical protein R8Z52_03365 [Vibrio porteresiae DSM 19223]
MFKQTAVALGVVALLSGCVTVDKVCTPDTTVPLTNSDVPTKTSTSSKVIVLPVDVDFKDPAVKRIQGTMLDAIEGQVVETGTVLVDRKIAKKLTSEIKLAEQSGRYNSKGVAIADYAVVTQLTSSDLSYKFEKAYSYKDKKGKVHHVPSKCKFEADVKGVMKVYSLPDMQLVKRVELKGDDNLSTETGNSRCPINNATYISMAVKASEEAVKESHELQEMLAASAPVQELRQCEVGSMVRIGVGSKRNVTPKADIVFSSQMKSDAGIETFEIGKGYVVNNASDAVKPDYSWVSIDEDLAQKIKKGDSAKLKFEPCPIWDLKCTAKNVGL